MSLEIDSNLVSRLIKQQFPQFSHLEIKKIKYDSVDNMVFHLGDEYLVRIPSDHKYYSQAKKEQRFLPILSKKLSLKIPQIVGFGEKSEIFPFEFSILKWIDGERSDLIEENNMNQFAFDLARFLKELYLIEIDEMDIPSIDNFYRGGDLSFYNQEFFDSLENISDLIDFDKAKEIWNLALNSKFEERSVLVHGDLSLNNILIKNQKLEAIIDFGLMARGDPACDLVIYFTFLKGEARNIFRNELNLDQKYWNRAAGWALWKAVISLDQIQDKKSIQSKQQISLIEDLLANNV